MPGPFHEFCLRLTKRLPSSKPQACWPATCPPLDQFERVLGYSWPAHFPLPQLRRPLLRSCTALVFERACDLLAFHVSYKQSTARTVTVARSFRQVSMVSPRERRATALWLRLRYRCEPLPYRGDLSFCVCFLSSIYFVRSVVCWVRVHSRCGKV